MNGLDWLIVAAFLIFILIIGVIVNKKSGQDTEGFFVAGRKLPWWLAGMSMAATNFGSDSPLHMSAMTRRSGILGCWFYFRQITMQMFTAIFFAKMWRRTKMITGVEFYEVRHGEKGAKILRGFFGAYQGLVMAPLRVGVFIIGMKKLCGILLQMPEYFNVPVLGNISSAWTISLSLTFIALAYSALSGIVGVAWTDLIEFIIAMVGTYALMFYGLNAVGGLEAMKSGVMNVLQSKNMDIRPFKIFPGMRELFTFPMLFYLLGFWWLSNIGGGGAIAQRFLASKSERDATLSGIWNTMVTFMVRFWPWFIIGFVSLIILPDITDHELAAPHLIYTILPHGLRGLIFVAFFYAFLSSIDSNFNVGASFVLNDLYRRFMFRDKSDKHYLLISRMVTVLIAVIGIFIASQDRGILDTLKLIVKLIAGAGVIQILRWYWWRINVWSELTVRLGAGLSTFIFTLMKRNGLTTPAKWIIDHFQLSQGPFAYKDLYFSVEFVLISLIAIVVAFLTLLLTKPDNEEVLKKFYGLVRPAGPGWKKIARLCPEVKITDNLKADFLGAIVGLFFAFSGIFGAGYLFLGAWVSSGIMFSVFIISFYLLNKILRHLEARNV